MPQFLSWVACASHDTKSDVFLLAGYVPQLKRS